MSRGEACSYIFTYYWYHMLIFFSAVALILLFTFHYFFGDEPPVFTCVLVNQAMDSERDDRITDAFSQHSGILPEQIVIDSGYNFSYGDIRLNGVNESSYEKFFLQWRNKELDAVVMPESFYEYCLELGGGFMDLNEMDTGDMPVYENQGRHDAILLGEDRLTGTLNGGEGEKLLLAFPESGTHQENCSAFLDYLLKVYEKSGGEGLEELFN